ncbi:hypothetical protein SVIOM342S_10173 [Streptomyces violaceorubidus]
MIRRQPGHRHRAADRVQRRDLVAQREAEADDAGHALLAVDGVAALPGPGEVGRQGLPAGVRVRGEGLVRPLGQLGVRPLGQQRLAQRAHVGGQPAAHAADRAQVFVRLPGRQVRHVVPVQPPQVDGLAQRLGRLVEIRPHRPHPGVGVQVTGAGEQGVDADAVERAGDVGADPAARDQGLEQRVHRAARHAQPVRQLLEPGRAVPAGGQYLQQFHRARRGLHLADAACRAARRATCLRHAADRNRTPPTH